MLRLLYRDRVCREGLRKGGDETLELCVVVIGTEDFLQ